jgi:hypothetical protein
LDVSLLGGQSGYHSWDYKTFSPFRVFRPVTVTGHHHIAENLTPAAVFLEPRGNRDRRLFTQARLRKAENQIEEVWKVEGRGKLQ